MRSHFLRKVRVAVTPPSSLIQTRLENGAVVAGYNRSGYGGRGVYIYGDQLEPELASLARFLKPGFVFVDVGANVGVYTMKAAREVGESGVVIAVEPFIESARQLYRNMLANHFHNVRILNFCIGRTTEPSQLYMHAGKPNSYSMVLDEAVDSIPVLSVSLDDLCRWEAISRLDYLKIDAEGAEEMILQGGMAAISRFRPIIQVEINRADSTTPEDYRRFSAPGSVNSVFIPSENREAIQTAQSLEWNETEMTSTRPKVMGAGRT